MARIEDIISEVVSVGIGGVCALGFVSIWCYGLWSGRFVASLRSVILCPKYRTREYSVRSRAPIDPGRCDNRSGGGVK